MTAYLFVPQRDKCTSPIRKSKPQTLPHNPHKSNSNQPCPRR